MPADRHIPVSPRKDEIYSRPPLAKWPEDPLNRPERVQLPPFSSLPRYVQTPPPPSTPKAYASPFRVNTPPFSAYTPSFPSPCFPISPTSLTSSSECYPPTLPPISSLFPEGLGTPHYRCDASPSKSHMRGFGSPMVESPTKAENRGVRTTASRSVRPNTSSSDTKDLHCKWPGCKREIAPLLDKEWRVHLHEHFDEATNLGTAKDKLVACRWGNCKGYMSTREKFVPHIRGHDLRFWILCTLCPSKYLTFSYLERHMIKCHATDEGASGSGGHSRSANDRDEVVMDLEE